MMNIRYCLRCENAFDIGTEYEICPECRGKAVIEEKKRWEE